MDAFAITGEWPVDHVEVGVISERTGVHLSDGADRVFALASVTKLFTAVGVLVAVEEGSISLDDDIEGATVRELLSHSAGIGPDGSLLDKPGRRRIYSNAGYDRLAAHVSTATDFEFASYLRLGVFEPLGMSQTELVGSAAKDGLSSVRDLITFVSGLDRILSAQTIAAMTSPQLPELVGVLPGYGRQAPNPWGLGPELRGNKSPHWTSLQNSSGTWGHFGQAGTFVWNDPSHRISCVVLTDRPFGPWAIERWPTFSSAVIDQFG